MIASIENFIAFNDTPPTRHFTPEDAPTLAPVVDALATMPPDRATNPQAAPETAKLGERRPQRDLRLMVLTTALVVSAVVIRNADARTMLLGAAVIVLMWEVISRRER